MDETKEWKMKGKPVLLILHMQPKVKETEAKVLAETGVIARQQALLNAFRARKLPVIFVNQKRLPVNVAVKVPAYGRIWENYKPGEDAPEDLRVIPELTPQPDEPVLYNWPPGAFNRSGLERALVLYEAETLVIAGFSSYGVVAGVLQEARNRYYSMILPRDASAAPNMEAHDVFMDIIAPVISLVTTTDDVIAHL